MVAQNTLHSDIFFKTLWILGCSLCLFLLVCSGGSRGLPGSSVGSVGYLRSLCDLHPWIFPAHFSLVAWGQAPKGWWDRLSGVRSLSLFLQLWQEARELPNLGLLNPEIRSSQDLLLFLHLHTTEGRCPAHLRVHIDEEAAIVLESLHHSGSQEACMDWPWESCMGRMVKGYLHPSILQAHALLK